MRIGVIGGTGLNRLTAATLPIALTTPYGSPSAVPERGRVGSVEVIFLARHGRPHTIAPHRVNYRANIWALRELGVSAVIATNAVGGIDPRLAPGDVLIPDQLVDYTWGRAHTYHDGDSLDHVDFTEPYNAELRRRVVEAAAPESIYDGGTYACTQGPRLETAAEIDRLERDGCSVVGMTGMPEAALARELALPYASICLVVNAAAGRGNGPITMAAIEAAMQRGAARAISLLTRLCERSDLGGEVGR
jgi:5'-deoxy-5'-methylthioadenosine phosphorylase